MKRSYFWYLIACDIRDYTLKTSFLNINEVENLLQVFDNFIKKSLLISPSDVKILKNTGDWYLFFSDRLSADAVIIRIFNFFDFIKKYNKEVIDDLYKLNIRFSCHKWVIYCKDTLSGKDYFWKDLNILYRILENTPADYIYVTENFYNDLRERDLIDKFLYFWEVSLKWIVWNIKIYTSFKNKDLKDKFERLFKEELLKNFKTQLEWDKFKIIDKVKNIDEFIFNISAITAVITSNPLPFADFSLVGVIYFYMINEISKYYWYNDNFISYKLLFSLLSSLGFEYMKDWFKIWLLKIGLPFLWGYIQIPISFAMTWSYGKLVSFYYYKKSVWEELSLEELKDYFMKRKKDGYNIAKKKKAQIIEYWKTNKEIFFEKIRKMRKELEKLKTQLKL